MTNLALLYVMQVVKVADFGVARVKVLKLQLAQLLQALKQVEICINSCQHLKQVERGRRVELSQARKKTRAAEERTIQASRKLRESEEQVKKMKQIIEIHMIAL